MLLEKLCLFFFLSLSLSLSQTITIIKLIVNFSVYKLLILPFWVLMCYPLGGMIAKETWLACFYLYKLFYYKLTVCITIVCIMIKVRYNLYVMTVCVCWLLHPKSWTFESQLLHLQLHGNFYCILCKSSGMNLHMVNLVKETGLY